MATRQGRAGTGAANVLVGHEVEATIERIVPGGYGLAHGAGRTLFVPFAALGDRARLRIERVGGGVAHAALVELLEASPDRVAPPHPELAACGGADFQHLAYPAQLAAKEAIVRDCLRRIAGVDPPEDLAVAPSSEQWGYRSRAEWRHDPERGLLGHVERESHRVCDVARDPMVVPALAEVLAGLRERLAAGELPAGVPEFRAAAGDEAVSISPPHGGGAEPEEVAATIGGERYALDADCFFQANRGLLPPLVAEALRFAPEAGGDRGQGGAAGQAIDLYCGVGLFTLPLARRFGRVVGVEAHRRSAAFAARNAAAAGLAKVRIETQPVARWLADAYRSLGRAPFVLLDPPRTGLDAAALRGLLRLRPGRIAYVSCDPATLARDLRALLAGGYALERVALFDLFPQTHHVEAVAHLARAA